MKVSTVISSSGITCLTATKQAAMIPWNPDTSMYLPNVDTQGLADNAHFLC